MKSKLSALALLQNETLLSIQILTKRINHNKVMTQIRLHFDIDTEGRSVKAVYTFLV